MYQNIEENYTIFAPGEHVVFMKDYNYYTEIVNDGDKCTSTDKLHSFEFHDGYEIFMISANRSIFYRNIVPVRVNKIGITVDRILYNSIPHFGTPLYENVLMKR